MKIHTKYYFRFKSILASLFASLFIITWPVDAQADANTFWNWTFLGNFGNAAGIFEVDSNNLIVGISNGYVYDYTPFSPVTPISALLSPGSYPLPKGNDNIFNPSSPFLTFKGVSFMADSQNINLYYETGNYHLTSDFGTSTGTLSAVSE